MNPAQMARRGGRSTPAPHLTNGRGDQAARLASALLGGVLVAHGLKRGALGGTALAVAGGALLYHGYQGVSDGSPAVGGDASPDASPRGGTVDVERSLTIGRSADELFALWRAPGTLGQVMGHLAAVTRAADGRTHWVVAAPLGRRFEWDTTVVEERPGELVRWASTDGAPVPNTGEVRFRPAPLDWGTEVTLRLGFGPAGGALGAAAGTLLGGLPGKLLGITALHRFKSLAETGEVPTLERQPAARGGGRDA